jgi:hypothetical protein
MLEENPQATIKLVTDFLAKCCRRIATINANGPPKTLFCRRRRAGLAVMELSGSKD